MLSLICLALYPLAVQYEVRKWRWLAPLTLAVYLLDVLANYTELFVLTADFPEAGEYTFSKRLYRLQSSNAWHRWIASLVIPYLNYFQPGHVPTPQS